MESLCLFSVIMLCLGSSVAVTTLSFMATPPRGRRHLPLLQATAPASLKVPRPPPLSNRVPLHKIQDAELCDESLSPVRVDVIAHRGASGSSPDHTLASYKEAFLAGADWIEIDIHSCKDGELVINHDVDLGETTDVADWAWAAPLKRRTVAPCQDVERSTLEGWMVKDLTLEEIKQLRVKEREECRPQEFNLMYTVPTLTETANFVQEMVDNERSHINMLGEKVTKSKWLQERNRYVLKYGRCRPNPGVGLYIETKRPGWYRSIGLPLEEKLAEVIDNSAFEGPVIIQSFEEDSLRRIQELKPDWKTVKLLTKLEVDSLMNNGDLDNFMKDLLSWGCDGIGPDKSSIIPEPTFPPQTSPLVKAAHSHGLVVHPYTFKSDVSHLHRIYGGNSGQEFAQFFKLGVDGVFADFPDHAVFARELFNRLQIRGVGFLLFSDVKGSF